MKKTIITSVFMVTFCFTYSLKAQPIIEWQKCLGGSTSEGAYSILQISDGGFLIAGFSESHDGDVSGNHGGFDEWIVRLDSNENIIWQKSLGGTNSDVANSAQPTSDGGFIIAGYSASNDGDVTGNHGAADYWIVKLDPSGDILWQKSLGGSGGDYANAIQQTTDGGFIIAGSSTSTDGDVSGNHGYSDDWIVKLDSAGNISWQKCFGGSSYDGANDVHQTSDGGFIVAGASYSNDGDVSGNHLDSNYYVYYADYWILKLDTGGNLIWQKCFGGSEIDFPTSILQTSDGSFLIAGFSESIDGDISGNHGDFDDWIVRLDSNGNLTWQKSLGGSGRDEALSIQQTTDGAFVVAGYTFSLNGDVSGNHGGTNNDDCWIVKLDTSGNIIWQKCLGGTGADGASSIKQTPDGGFIVAGSSGSNDGDVSGNHGIYDYWIVKLDAGIATNVQEVPSTNDFSLSPNPASNLFTTQLQLYNSETFNAAITITNVLGEIVFEKTSSCINGNLNEKISLDKKFAAGMYFVTVRSDKQQWEKPLVVVRSK